ncbi:Sortase family protein [Streptomyces zhaozhouensis]|uniref:Sortase family protein n=1 Tax=Streptomyces zhaozhouensis TaxID=1300267 RepID=A0A286DV55_9ACTN|nr:class F sortase [Streptomyces zhaozhouensis]SOD62483.1 Sortase family protein [Streptomyces zhaozhouensis]
MARNRRAAAKPRLPRLPNALRAGPGWPRALARVRRRLAAPRRVAGPATAPARPRGPAERPTERPAGPRRLTARATAALRRLTGGLRDAGPATVRLVRDRKGGASLGQARVAVATAVRGAAGPPPPPPGTRTRHQRQSLRTRRLETTVAVAVVVGGLLVGVFAPSGGETSVREARASSSIAEGVSRPDAVDAPAAAPDAGSTANLSGSGEAGAAAVAPPLERSVPIRVRIPYLATDVEVFGADLTPDGGPPSPSEEDAQRAAWYAGGVSPGERGAAILVGHLDTYDGPAAFAGLGSLQPGETIEVDRADGDVAVFTVDSVEQYPKSDFPDERVYGSVTSPQLRLITCGGRWTQDGGYDSNIVAYARLTDSATYTPEAHDAYPEPAPEPVPLQDPGPDPGPDPALEPEAYPGPDPAWNGG